MRAFLQAKIWRYLKDHPGAVPEHLRGDLKISKDAGANAFARMCKEGTGRTEGRSRASRWFAVGDIEPKDDRMWARTTTRPKPVHPRYVPPPFTELERCMGFAACVPITGKLRVHRMSNKVNTKAAPRGHSRQNDQVSEAAD